MKNLVFIGATSAIVHEVARNFAPQAKILLIGRNHSHLQQNAADLIARGADDVHVIAEDLGNLPRLETLWTQVSSHFSSIDLCLVGHGYLGDQMTAEKSTEEACKIFQINTLSYLVLLTHIANFFEIQGSGIVAVITSVAGDRGRKSNYVYGASKAAVTTLLQGIRNRLASKNVSVVDLRPGFIDTPMTKHLSKRPMAASAQAAGQIIHKSIQKRQDVVYVPFRWLLVMTVIKLIPERIFKRLNL